MVEENAGLRQPEQKKGFFEKMSFFQKALLFMGVIIVLLLAVAIVLGGIKSFYEFFFYLIVFVIIIVGAYIVIKATGLILKPKYFSPREDLRTKLTNMAIDYKPDNLANLWFIGDIGKKRVLAGKITGCLHIPYFTGDIMRYKEDCEINGIKHTKGEVIYSETRTLNGKKVPLYENIKMLDDGDTFFMAEKGWFIFKKTHYIRSHRSYHSTLNGDVDIFDINPYPYGSFEYPYKQIQERINQIMIQNQIETIIATHEHQHDLISQSTDAGLYSNPLMRFNIKQNAELSGDTE
jgi:hypothetical protein